MATATKTLAAVLAAVIAKVGDADGTLTAALNEFAPADDAETAAAAALADQVAALEKTVSELPAPAEPFDPTALEGRVTALEDATSAAGPVVVDLEPLTARVTALEDRPQVAAAPSVVHEETISGGGPALPTLSADPLPTAVIGESYAAQVGVSGGIAPYQFSISSGNLPDGLSLKAGGAIVGTPTQPGTFSVDVRADDANGSVAVQEFGFVVDHPPAPAVEEAAVA